MTNHSLQIHRFLRSALSRPPSVPISPDYPDIVQPIVTSAQKEQSDFLAHGQQMDPTNGQLDAALDTSLKLMEENGASAADPASTLAAARAILATFGPKVLVINPYRRRLNFS